MSNSYQAAVEGGKK